MIFLENLHLMMFQNVKKNVPNMVIFAQVSELGTKVHMKEHVC